MEPRARPAATRGQQPGPDTASTTRKTGTRTDTEHEDHNTPNKRKHLKSLVLPRRGPDRPGCTADYAAGWRHFVAEVPSIAELSTQTERLGLVHDQLSAESVEIIWREDTLVRRRASGSHHAPRELDVPFPDDYTWQCQPRSG